MVTVLSRTACNPLKAVSRIILIYSPVSVSQLLVPSPGSIITQWGCSCAGLQYRSLIRAAFHQSRFSSYRDDLLVTIDSVYPTLSCHGEIDRCCLIYLIAATKIKKGSWKRSKQNWQEGLIWRRYPLCGTLLVRGRRYLGRHSLTRRDRSLRSKSVILTPNLSGDIVHEEIVDGVFLCV